MHAYFGAQILYTLHKLGDQLRVGAFNQALRVLQVLNGAVIGAMQVKVLGARQVYAGDVSG